MQAYHFFLFNDILLYAASSRNWKGVTYKVAVFSCFFAILQSAVGSGCHACPVCAWCLRVTWRVCLVQSFCLTALVSGT